MLDVFCGCEEEHLSSTYPVCLRWPLQVPTFDRTMRAKPVVRRRVHD